MRRLRSRKSGSAIRIEGESHERGAQFVRCKKALPHLGETLAEDYLEPLGLSAGALAKQMGLKGRQRVERVVRGQQAITADTALRLARVFTNTSPEFWMNLQTSHDLSAAQIEARTELAEDACVTSAPWKRRWPFRKAGTAQTKQDVEEDRQASRYEHDPDDNP